MSLIGGLVHNGKIKGSLSKEFSWKCQFAERDKSKGRAKGGIITGIRKEFEELDVKVINVNGVQERRIRVEGELWRILTVYNGGKMKEMRKKIEETVSELEEERLCIGGDFNARTGREGKKYESGDEKEMRRNSKDRTINSDGKDLLGLTEERGWEIGNGNIRGDEEGEMTYNGARGASVVDYVIINQNAEEKIEKLTVGERVESDHQPLEVVLKERLEKEKRKTKKEFREITVWSEDGIDKYREESRKIKIEGEEIETIWKNLKKGVEEIRVRKKISLRKKRIGEKDWWDSECKRRKRRVKRAYKEWKRGGKGREEYVILRREFRELCREKEAKKNKKFEEELRNVRSEAQIWKLINRGRKDIRPIEEGILHLEEWQNYFCHILEGHKKRKEEGRKEREQEEGQEDDLRDEEIEQQIVNLKRRKAVGVDGIENEAWIYSEGQLRKKLKEMLRRVWRREGFPEEWREGIIMPIYKKGDPTKIENYRGISLLNSAYKIYAGIITERLKEEAEREKALQETQAGFRKRRGTMDNVYILQHVIKRELGKKGGRIFGFFIDLKAAFDKVDREELWIAMEKRGISIGLINRIKEIYRSTKNAVKVHGGVSDWFWTEKGLRQGCPLSPTLFSLLIADIEEELKKGQVGGARIGNERIWSLAYADDIVILAKDEESLKEMMKRMERYLKKKKLQLNTEKSKIIVSEREGAREERQNGSGKEGK